MIANIEILLASKSPRRQQLLGQLAIPFQCAPALDVDESFPPMPAEAVPEYLSQKKFDAYHDLQLKDRQLLLTADTVVILNGEVIGKPEDRQDAIAILKKLSSNKHTVITGVTIGNRQQKISFSAFTDVYFDQLSEEEIIFYVDTFKPFDKAGAYGVQEWLGSIAVCRIDGCFYNIMGLPLYEVYKNIQKLSSIL